MATKKKNCWSRKIPLLKPRFPWRTLRPLMKRRLIWRRPLMAAI